MTREEALKKALEYYEGNELQANIFIDKYAHCDGDRNYYESTPNETLMRAAKEFARIEQTYKPKNKKYNLKDENVIFSFFKDFKYIIPQGSVLAGIGLKDYTTLSNCFVLKSPYDSVGGIVYSDAELANVYKRRGGAGLDISNLRPKNTKVYNASKTTTGAVSFMERYSNTTKEIGMNGRRGALLVTIDVKHPDIFDFVNSKADLTKINGANISVKIDNEFINAVKNNEDFYLRYPVDLDLSKFTKDYIDAPYGQMHYIEDHENNNKICYVKKIKAKDLWDNIIHNNWLSAEPGILFWDNQNNYSLSNKYPNFQNVSCNPCGELCMSADEACRLMAVNLFNLVKNPFTTSAYVDMQELFDIFYVATYLCDDLVDLDIEKIDNIILKVKLDEQPDYIKQSEIKLWEDIREKAIAGRRIGLGFTGLADMLAALNLKYGSNESKEAIKEVMHIATKAMIIASSDMALERGKFPIYDKKYEYGLYHDFLKNEMPKAYEYMMNSGRRNISLSTVAPTGTISILAGVSSGIEPVFQLSYKRRKKINGNNIPSNAIKDDSGDFYEEFDVVHPGLKKWSEIAKENDISKSPYFNCTAPELNPEDRIDIQAVVQKYITHSISSTVNLSKEVTEKTISDIYMQAAEKGLKGCTVYRDGSRSGILVSKENKVNKSYKRPKELPCEVLRFNNDDENWIAYIGFRDEKPYEIFCGKSEDAFNIPKYVKDGFIIKEKTNGISNYKFKYKDKHGYNIIIEGLNRCFNPEYWNYAIFVSLSLRENIPLTTIVNQVSKLKLKDDYIGTWKNGMVRILSHLIPDGKVKGDKCPKCGQESLVRESGCVRCSNCGWSKCG